jgi:WD40 repeat protein/tetratricopeptide (TPR) repeat protein
MSPEQAEGRWDVVGPASDIYSLGATLHALLTGHAPFEGPAPLAVLEKVRRGEFMPPRQRLREVPRPLEAVCLKAMALRPEDRYADAIALAADVERWLAEERVSAYRESWSERLARWSRAHRALVRFAAVTGLAFLVTAGAAAILVMRSRSEAVRLAAQGTLRRTFDVELDRGDWSAHHLDQMEGLLGELERLAPDEAAAARQRLDQQLAESVRQGLAARPGEEEVARAEAVIARLTARRPEAAAELRQLLQNRVSAWKPVFDLQAPFRDIDALFAPGAAPPHPDSDPPRLEFAGPPDTGAVWEIQVPCRAHAEIEAVLPADGWEKATRLGLALNFERGHLGPVLALDLAPGGGAVATVGTDGTAQLRDPDTGRVRLVCRGHRGKVTAVAFAPDGKVLATGGADGTVRLWDAATGRDLGTLAGHTATVNHLVFAPDGKLLASAGGDKTVRLWDVAGRTTRTVLRKHTEWVMAVAFSPDGRTLATGGLDRVVHLWDVATAEVRRSLPAAVGQVTGLAFSPDGTLLASGGLQGVRLWDARTGSLRTTISEGAPVRCLAFGPGGHILATASFDNVNVVRLWDVETGQARSALEGHLEEVNALRFTPDGKTLLTASTDRTIRLWDVELGQLRRLWQVRGYTFVLQAPAAATLGEAVRAGKSPELQISRDGAVLRRRDVRLGPGPLRLRARRAGDRLSVQVGDQPPVLFEDAFPPGSGDGGTFAVLASGPLQVQRLSATVQDRPAELSPLEEGDLLYARGQCAEALARFEAQARRATDARTAQEARCKQGLCLLALNRRTDAAACFAELVDQPGERWPVIAACQLAVLRLGQKRLEEADGLLTGLQARYRFEDLAAFLSDSDRHQLLKVSRPPDTTEAFVMVHYEPDRVRRLQRAATLEELFGASPGRRLQTRHMLVEAYAAAGQDGQARALLEETLPDPGLLPAQRLWSVGRLAWMHLYQGRPKEALELLNRWLLNPDGTYRPDALFLLRTRAAAHANLQEWDLAERDVEEFLRRAGAESTPGTLAEVYLLQGFVREGRGDAAGARAAWNEGYDRVQGTPGLYVVHASILGSLTGRLNDADVRRMVDELLGKLPGTGRINLKQALTNPLFPWAAVTPVLRDCWRSHRGRELARRLAFQQDSFFERHSVPILIFALETARHGAAPKELTPEQEDVVWDQLNQALAAYRAGRLKDEHVFAFCLCWGLKLGRFGWPAVAAAPDPAVRALLAYILGRCYRQRGYGDADFFFRTAADDAPADTPLGKLARQELARPAAP